MNVVLQLALCYNHSQSPVYHSPPTAIEKRLNSGYFFFPPLSHSCYFSSSQYEMHLNFINSVVILLNSLAGLLALLMKDNCC